MNTSRLERDTDTVLNKNYFPVQLLLVNEQYHFNDELRQNHYHHLGMSENR